MLGSSAKLFASEKKPKVRVALIGVGARGLSHLNLCLHRDDVEVVAFADPDTAYTVPKAKAMIEKVYGGKRKVAEYTNGPEDFRNMIKRDDVDAVVIATPWEWHTIMAVACMKAGKTPAVEVCGASDIQVPYVGHDCPQIHAQGIRIDNRSRKSQSRVQAVPPASQS